MARTKGMLNLSGNLEVNAQAPLDARTIVPTEADLTVASNFPYPYVGLEVYVTGTGKKFRLTNLDVTQSSSWHEIGEGGGGETYSDFTGATASTAGAHGLVPAPSAGDEDKVLFGNGLWGALPSVNLSVLSNEAFIFSETEKPVGMWTDRKLLYAKAIKKDGVLSGNVSINHGIDNIDRICFAFSGTLDGSNAWYPFSRISGDGYFIGISGANRTSVNVFVNDAFGSAVTNAVVILFYTKTTDSPLPSDVKFAGVLSDGTVVYKKTVSTGGSVPSGATLIYRLPLLNSTDVVYFTR